MAKVFHFLQSSKVLLTFFASATLWSLHLPASAQENIPIQGKITDRRTGEPLIGANILVKSLKTGTVSNIDGEFRLNIPSLPATLSFGYTGYRPEEIDIYERPSEAIIVSLAENVLNEVVVVGYGTQKRSELTGSVASVSKASLEAPAVSFDNLLSGAIAGVQVTQSSGQPGATASIRIRGGNSITGGNEPLYVIDGQIMYNNNSATSAGIELSGAGLNALATINPADIASIEVLKDAAATAIYGSRGANGVILVTTRKGTGKDRISYTGSVGRSVAGKKLDLLNAREWALLRNDILASDPSLLTSNTPFTQAEIDAFGDGYDWQDAALRTAWTQSHQLSVSGGDAKTQYLISGNYHDQEGVVVNSGFERYSLRANLQRKFNDRFKTGLNISASSSRQTGIANVSSGFLGADAYTSLLLTPPVVPIYEADGSYHFDDTYRLDQNALAELTDVTNETKVNRTFGNFFAEYSILPGLTAKINTGADLINAKQNFFAPSHTAGGLGSNGRATVGSNATKSWQTELTLTYDRVFSDIHHLTALAGYTAEKTASEGAVASATEFPNETVKYNALQSGKPALVSSNAPVSALNSYLGRVNYTLRNRYNATVSFRADGSSRFASSHKWGYFPSLGLSWNISEESFLKGVKPVGSLKLRLSAGSTGNQEIGDFQYLQKYTPVQYELGGQVLTGYVPENIANPGLKWETTTQYNGGFDLGLLNDRISVVFDAYYKLTTDLLVEVPVPTSSGHSKGLKNVGNVSNRGIELSINADVIRGRKSRSLNWQTAFVFALNRNRVESLGDDVSDYKPRVPNSNIGRFNPLIVKEGYPLGTFWGYETAGIVQQGEDVSQIPVPGWSTGVKPGDRKYVNHGGDPAIINDDDRVILGSAQPKFTFGFTNTFSYKGFDLLALLQGSYGNKLYNALRSQLEITATNTNASGVFRDRWTTDHASSDVPRVTNSPNALVSDRLVEDASYLRLKSITLGYALPKGWTKAARLEKVRLFVTGQNLLTITPYSGYDPEANTYEQNSLYQGIDMGAYPSSKGWLAGIEITL